MAGVVAILARSLCALASDKKADVDAYVYRRRPATLLGAGIVLEQTRNKNETDCLPGEMRMLCENEPIRVLDL